MSPPGINYSKILNSKSEFIVFLGEAQDQGNIAQRAQGLLRSLGVNGQPNLVFDQLNGFTVLLTGQQARRLQALGGVKSVEANATVLLEPPTLKAAVSSSLKPEEVGSTNLAIYADSIASSGETLPWGIRSVWQGNDISTRGNFASETYAFVIDSGVLDSTGDLNLARTGNWHRSWIIGETAFTDGNGHGTHVAGTLAALANGTGVVGVAPGAQVVSLKVFNSSGGGASYATIISAINHAAAIINNNGLDKKKVVINMSLGGGFSSALDTAVKNAANQGIRLVVAAGNNGQDADSYSPAAAGDHPNVFTISAVDNQYNMTSWSNWDQANSPNNVDDVDYAAPGVSILSYYKNGALAYLSGTSMAAPHVAGILLAGAPQAGPLASPYYSGTADPFALGILLETDNQPPTNEPILPTYTISSTASGIDEGENLAILITTTNVNQGTQLYWKISGGVDTNDFAEVFTLEGSISVDAVGNGKVSLNAIADSKTEGDEAMIFTLYSDSTRNIKIGETTVTIRDTSTEPATSFNQVLWGTTNSDVITGGQGNDIISGALANGDSAEEMGSGQVDILTGRAGKDIFVLGDGRGVFYDDRNSRSGGSSDYALIKDFTSGEDKIQLARGSYLLSTSSNKLYLYWDQNRNGRLDRWFSTDELIAVVEGVTNLSSSDVIWG